MWLTRNSSRILRQLKFQVRQTINSWRYYFICRTTNFSNVLIGYRIEKFSLSYSQLIRLKNLSYGKCNITLTLQNCHCIFVYSCCRFNDKCNSFVAHCPILSGVNQHAKRTTLTDCRLITSFKGESAFFPHPNSTLCVLPRWQQVDKHTRYSRAFGDGLMTAATAAPLINHSYAPSARIDGIR